jgi:hypothetical protein
VAHLRDDLAAGIGRQISCCILPRLPPDGVRRHRLRTMPDADSGATSALSARIGEDGSDHPPCIGSGMVRGVSYDDHLDRDDLVVRLPQFHPLVIARARR